MRKDLFLKFLIFKLFSLKQVGRGLGKEKGEILLENASVLEAACWSVLCYMNSLNRNSSILVVLEEACCLHPVSFVHRLLKPRSLCFCLEVASFPTLFKVLAPKLPAHWDNLGSLKKHWCPCPIQSWDLSLEHCIFSKEPQMITRWQVWEPLGSVHGECVNVADLPTTQTCSTL